MDNGMCGIRCDKLNLYLINISSTDTDIIISNEILCVRFYTDFL